MVFSYRKLMQVAENNIKRDLKALSNRHDLGRDKEVHDLFSIILGEVSDLHAGGHIFNGKLIDLERQKYFQQFKGWCMPAERQGYIRARVHDFL